jgi:hypothetical protein
MDSHILFKSGSTARLKMSLQVEIQDFGTLNSDFHYHNLKIMYMQLKLSYFNF